MPVVDISVEASTVSVNVVEGGGIPSVDVYKDGVLVVKATKLNFTGSGVGVFSSGGGVARIAVSSGGSSGSSNSYFPSGW